MAHQLRTLTPSENLKLFWGFAVQPFLAAGLAFVSFPFVLLDRTGHTADGGLPGDVTDAAISVAAGACLVAFVVTLVAAFPTAMWLVRRQRISLGRALLFGLGFGNLPVLLGTVLSGGSGAAGPLPGFVLASMLGLAGAAAFWAIAIRGRDLSRDAPVSHRS